MTGAVGLRRVPKQFMKTTQSNSINTRTKTIIEEIESRLSVADKLEETSPPVCNRAKHCAKAF